MDTLISVLAVLGIGAAAWHLLRAAFRFLTGKAWGVWASGMADTHARHGDVTGVQEARASADRASSTRRGALVEGLGWILLLLAPSLTPWSQPIYAGYAVLWLVPWRRRR